MDDYTITVKKVNYYGNQKKPKKTNFPKEACN